MQWPTHSGILLPIGRKVKEVPYEESYQYLWLAHLFGINLHRTQTRIHKEHLIMVRKTWASFLNARNKTVTHNMWSAAVFRYFFGMVRWSKRDLRVLNRSTWNIYTCQDEKVVVA